MRKIAKEVKRALQDLSSLLRFWWKPTSKNAYYILRRAAKEMDCCDLADAREFLSWKIEVKSAQNFKVEALSKKRSS